MAIEPKYITRYTKPPKSDLPTQQLIMIRLLICLIQLPNCEVHMLEQIHHNLDLDPFQSVATNITYILRNL